MTTENVLKESYKGFGRALKKCYPSIISFSLIGISVFALSMLWPSLIIPLGLFILLPSLLSLIRSMFEPDDKPDLNGGHFFSRLFSYFIPPFFGCFRIFRALFFSLLFSLAFGSLFAGMYFLGAKGYPEFMVPFEDLISVFRTSTMDEVLLRINSNSSLSAYFYWSQLAFFFFFSLFFFYEISFYGLSAGLRCLIPEGPNRGVNLIFTGSIKQVRGPFYGDFFSSLWPIFLIFILGFAAGASISYFFLPISSLQGCIFSLGFAFLLILPFIPLYLSVLENMESKYSEHISEYSVDRAEMTLNELIKQNRLSHEDIEKFRNQIKAAREGIAREKEEFKKENENGSNNEGKK